jgi:uncharacterized membrane protein YgdD (TMEM256/DUF423 family)
MMFSARLYLLVSAISGLLSVALGAFGAHGLQSFVSPGMLAAFQTGVKYQLMHTIVLLVLATLLLVANTGPVVTKYLKVSANFMVIGIMLFSGSLYTMTFMSAVGGFPTWLGPITPIGGLAFIMGWIFLMVAALKLPIEEQ